MHRSRNFRTAALLALFMFVFTLGPVMPAIADDQDTSSAQTDGEPTDPQSIVDWLREIGFDPDALGISVSTPLDALLDLLRSLGLIPPEESGS